MTIERKQIAHGVSIPIIGYGTGTAWYKTPDKPLDQGLIKSIKTALSLGYTHIDTAEMYCTEAEVGIAIKESGVSRTGLFVTTKVLQSIKNPVQALNDSLARMQLDYVDLFLIHFPFFGKESHGISLTEAWVEMDKIYKSGKAKAVGVSNFRPRDIEEIMSLGLVKPAVNQIEFHPYLQQNSIVEACKKYEIATEVYSPLCPLVNSKDGPVDEVVKSLANKYNKSVEQILLRWSMQKGNIIITTSGKEERLREYLLATEFNLTAEEVTMIEEEGKKRTFRTYFQDQVWEDTEALGVLPAV